MKNILLISVALFTISSFAQNNLVPNSTFEKIEKKVKGKGEIKAATPWVSPTLSLADLYVPKIKDFNISIPENSYGEEKPMEGSGYAGILAYSYKGKAPRSYLQVKLTKKLKAGKEYCVQYHVSLADLSKYACNHLAVAITDKAVTANNTDILQFDSFIESTKLKVYDKQYYWTPICGVFQAMGGEQYLTIGNFTEDSELNTRKVKRPRGFTKPQSYDAYYYIDNVSVEEIGESDKCDCDIVPGMENAETEKSKFSSEKHVQKKAVEIINTDGTSSIHKPNDKGAVKKGGSLFDGQEDLVLLFEKGLYSIKSSTVKLDLVLAYMKKNATSKILIAGYFDASEADVAKLDGRRVGAIYKYLISKGIAKERMERELGGNSPVDKKVVTKNMRVEISLISKD